MHNSQFTIERQKNKTKTKDKKQNIKSLKPNIKTIEGFKGDLFYFLSYIWAFGTKIGFGLIPSFFVIL
jgi:hypothetical protein